MEDLTATGSFEAEATIMATNNGIDSIKDEENDIDEDIKMATAMALAIQNNPNLTPDEIHELLGQQTPATASAGSTTKPKPALMTSNTQTHHHQFRLPNMFSTANVTVMDDANSSSSHNRGTASVVAPRLPPQLQGLADRARGRLQDIMLHATAAATAVATAPKDHNDNDTSDGSHAIMVSSSVADRTILGMAWKRRGGFAKYTTTSCWERRFFCLTHGGSRLVYYANDNNDPHNGLAPNSEPRGTIDLSQHNVCITSGHSGAPTPFAISIKNNHGETKWKMCCDTHAVQIRWFIQLSHSTIRHSVEAYNASLKTATENDTSSLLLDYTMYYPPSEGATTGIASTQKTTALWALDAVTVTLEDGVDDEAIQKIVDMNAAAVTTSTEVVWSDADHVKTREEVVQAAPTYATVSSVNALYLFWNVGAILARAISPSWFWYFLITGNIIIYRMVETIVDWKSLTQHIYRAPMKPLIVPVHGQSSSTDACPMAPDRYIPIAGSSSIELENADDDPVNAAGEHFAGWRKVPGSLLKVRAHGYATTKEKIFSPGELYDCVAVDVFESPQRYPDMAPRVQLPKVEDDDQVKTWRAPNIFIVSIALPTDPPKMGKSSSDGGGYTVTMYYKLKDSTRELLRKLTSDGFDGSASETKDDPRVNAVRLWEEWIRRAPTDPKFMARFKVVPLAHNLSDIGMPGWISKYNGKPFLIKRAGITGFIHTHPQLSCVEFDVSLHPFPYLAKQGICFMKDSYFKKILVTFGFVIEGRSDDELPETVIGCMQLCYPDPQYAIQAKDFFNGTAPRSINDSSNNEIETKRSTEQSDDDTA